MTHFESLDKMLLLFYYRHVSFTAENLYKEIGLESEHNAEILALELCDINFAKQDVMQGQGYIGRTISYRVSVKAISFIETLQSNPMLNEYHNKPYSYYLKLQEPTVVEVVKEKKINKHRYLTWEFYIEDWAKRLVIIGFVGIAAIIVLIFPQLKSCKDKVINKLSPKQEIKILIEPKQKTK